MIFFGVASCKAWGIAGGAEIAPQLGFKYLVLVNFYKTLFVSARGPLFNGPGMVAS